MGSVTWFGVSVDQVTKQQRDTPSTLFVEDGLESTGDGVPATIVQASQEYD
jgi:hypothetical protein